MDNQNLLLDYYVTEVLSVTQAHAKGVVVPAKPLLMVSVIDYINQGKCSDNKIIFTDLIDFYDTNLKLTNACVTPMSYPFYFMGSESFWHLRRKNQFIKTKAPSAKFIRENIEYAYLDNSLWDLLQEEQVRQLLRETIVTHFLTRKTN